MDAKHGKEADDRPGSEPSGETGTTEIRLPGAPERQRILDLGASVWAFSALAGALEGGILDELATPQTPAQISERTGTSAALIEAVLDVLTALDLVRVTGDAFVCTPGMWSIPVVGGKRSSARICVPPTYWRQNSRNVSGPVMQPREGGGIRIQRCSTLGGRAQWSRSPSGPSGLSPPWRVSRRHCTPQPHTSSTWGRGWCGRLRERPSPARYAGRAD